MLKMEWTNLWRRMPAYASFMHGPCLQMRDVRCVRDGDALDRQANLDATICAFAAPARLVDQRLRFETGEAPGIFGACCGRYLNCTGSDTGEAPRCVWHAYALINGRAQSSLPRSVLWWVRLCLCTVPRTVAFDYRE